MQGRDPLFAGYMAARINVVLLAPSHCSTSCFQIFRSGRASCALSSVTGWYFVLRTARPIVRAAAARWNFAVPFERGESQLFFVRFRDPLRTRDCTQAARAPSTAKQCWVFDCYGRACHGRRVRGYGCKLKAGDIVGVLLNTANHSLSFFVEGIFVTRLAQGSRDRRLR